MSYFLKFIKRPNHKIDYFLLGALVLVFGAVLSVFLLLNKSRKASEDTFKAVERTRNVMLMCADVQSDIVTIESATRGYIITGDRQYLKPYRTSSVSIITKINTLKRLTEGNASQQKRISELSDLMAQRISVSEKLILSVRSGTFRASKTLTIAGPGLRLSDTIKSLLQEIRSEEVDHLGERKLKNERSVRRSANLSNMLAALILVIVFFGVLFVSRALRTRRKAEIAARASELYLKSVLDNIADGVIVLDAAHQIELCNPAAARIFGEYAQYLFPVQPSDEYGLFDIESRAPVAGQDHPVVRLFAGEAGHSEEFLVKNPLAQGGRYVSVRGGVLAPGYGRKRAGVIVIHDISEMKLAHEQLLVANKELDSFCYSISHDLRAPLRSISGFSKILLEDYADKLDAEAVRLSNVIIRSAEKMGRLIDDLLKFSRLSKQELSRVRVDMTSKFRSALDRVLAHGQPKGAKFTIAEMPTAYADQDLIGQVLVNLLSNAIKYSSKKENPTVEAGALDNDGEVVYYVRDNGEGFDMQYYDKLFQVFQRLHSEKEFEGTGVGLSIVQRIINRHNGKIWAESTPGQGSVFYFTLPEPKNRI